MPKSKQRKDHKKKVDNRNTIIKAEIKKQKILFEQAMMEQINAMKEKMSEETTTSETIKLNTDGFVQSAEIL
jgi:hypothetical protein